MDTYDPVCRLRFQPISVLPVISKVFETVIFDQLIEYFTNTNLFSSQQYGFRKNASTELAALELIDILLTQLEDFKIPVNFYMDLYMAANIQLSISNELQKICKCLDLNKLHLNVAKSKFMLFHMPQKVIPQLHFSFNGSPIDYVTEFIFLGLTLDCNLNFKSHLKTIGNKISRVIGLLHKLKYIFPTYLLRMIYNSLILPHINYCLLA